MGRIARLTVVVGVLAAGCGGPSARPATSRSLLDEPLPEPDEAAPEPVDALTIAVSRRDDPAVLVVDVTLPRAVAGLRARAADTTDPFTALEVTDANGPVEVERTVEDGHVRITLPATVAPIVVHAERPAAPGDRAVVEVDGRALFATLDAVPLPDDEETRPTRLAPSAPPALLFSTLGTATRTVDATTGELGSVAVLQGDLETARFESREGVDDVVVAGSHQFDARWLAAEAALIRTTVDAYLGRLDPGRFTVLVRSETRAPGAPPFTVTPAARGLAVRADEAASWDARGRVPLAHVLMRRWVGGLVQVRDDEGAAAGENWFSLGVSRYFALRVLLSLGLLDPGELAGELTVLERALAFGGDADDRTRHLAPMARGALYAARLDALLARAGDDAPRNLRLLLFPFFSDEHSPLTTAAIRDEIARALGEREAETFVAAVDGDGPIDVPRGAFGGCVRSARGTLRSFALGFALPDEATLPLELEQVAGPAARAGLRDGDLVDQLTFVQGDPDVPVVAHVPGEAPRDVRYLPYDREARGRTWEPLEDDEQSCAPR